MKKFLAGSFTALFLGVVVGCGGGDGGSAPAAPETPAPEADASEGSGTAGEEEAAAEGE